MRPLTRATAAVALFVATTWAGLHPDPAQAAEARRVLVARKASAPFAEALEAIRRELGPGYQVTDAILDADATAPSFAKALNEARPDLVIALDNQAVGLLMHQGAQRGVAGMALNLASVLKGNAHVSGVAYEVPAFTIVTRFRFLVNKPIRKVLAFHRKSEHAALVAEARAQLAKENITLVAVNAEEKGATRSAVRDFLIAEAATRTRASGADAVWVLADNGLVNAETLHAAWVPLARESGLPLLCGIDKFAQKDADFCSFSASPQHSDLGSQLAQQAIAILEDGQAPAKIGVEHIVSVTQTLNLDKLSRLKIQVREENLNGVNAVR